MEWSGSRVVQTTDDNGHTRPTSMAYAQKQACVAKGRHVEGMRNAKVQVRDRTKEETREKRKGRRGKRELTAVRGNNTDHAGKSELSQARRACERA